MSVSNAQVKRFIEMIAPIAVRQAKKHDNKIFPSVCIAQACCESAYGTSPKMVNANALFGIKVGKSKWHFGNAWKDKAYSTKTKECYDGKTYTNIVDLFRAYDSVEDAVEDYFDMLCTASRYKHALNRLTPLACIQGIQKAPYATAPDYVSTIMNIIHKYNLEKYDSFTETGYSNDNQTDNPYVLSDALIKRGMKGESVKWLQFELNKNGADLVCDGLFGRKTLEAVIDYQQTHKPLKVDGLCGQQTIKSLKGE